MKNILIFILTISILHASIKDAVDYASYWINLDYISESLCINRSEEPLCKGKCVLKETLVNNHENEGNLPASIQEDSRTVFYWPVKVPYLINKNQSSEQDMVGYSEKIYVFSFSKALFRPPRSIL